MGLFVKASATALVESPMVIFFFFLVKVLFSFLLKVNAVIDGDFVVHRNYVDISVAVAGPRGLVVPVLRLVCFAFFCAFEVEYFLETLTRKALQKSKGTLVFLAKRHKKKLSEWRTWLAEPLP